MSQLDQIRNEINEIDVKMAALFEQRMHLCEQVAAFKQERGLSVRDAARERELIERSTACIESEVIGSYYAQFLRKVIDLSCAYQTRLMEGMQVAYCGVEGAYAYIAARRMFPQARLVSYPDFSQAYHAVERGEADSVVLPLENSYAGEVGTVMDLLFSGELFINQVLDFDITHNLLGVASATAGTVRTVVSHPQALRQCDDYIRSHGFKTESYANTAMAAQRVREANDPTLAAIASDEAAEIFGLQVLDHNLSTSRNNTTRFAALSRTRNQPKTTGKREDENFLLVFTVQNDAGSLAQTLNIIGAHGYNMRTLRSRPMKDLSWKYFFYVEAEGSINTTNGREMLQELSATCAKLRLVGSYYANNI